MLTTWSKRVRCESVCFAHCRSHRATRDHHATRQDHAVRRRRALQARRHRRPEAQRLEDACVEQRRLVTQRLEAALGQLGAAVRQQRLYLAPHTLQQRWLVRELE